MTTGIRTTADFDRLQAAIQPTDVVARDMEMKWGVGRLPMLVSAATVLWWRQGWQQYSSAISEGDTQTVERLAPKIRTALVQMDREALATGHRPLSPVVWEAAMPDGKVLVVTRTSEEAYAVSASLNGRAAVVYSMEEVAIILAAVRQADEIKVAFPGAEVRTGQSTYSQVIRSKAMARDWTSSDPFFDVLHSEEIEA